MGKRIFKIANSLPQISRFRVIAGILVAIFFSFFLYSFLCLSREIFRVFSVTREFDMWVFTDQQVNFYNLFFAYISVIFSQSICFRFWIEMPRKINGKKNYRITSIVNDQRGLNWFFLFWFSEMAVVYGIMFALNFPAGFYVFSFYPDYMYIFILVVIFLFLQAWNTIRLSFKEHSLRWMMISFGIISVLAFGLSRINLIDYKTMNQSFLDQNIDYKYTLDLVETDCYERQYNFSLIENIYLVKSKNPNKPDPIILIEKREVELCGFGEAIIERRLTRTKSELYDLDYKIHIDKSIKMEFVNQIKKELTNSGINKISYAVLPENPVFDKRFYKLFLFRIKIYDFTLEAFEPKEMYARIKNFKNIIEIKQNIIGQCYINDIEIENGNINKTIRNIIIQDPTNYIIKFHVNDDIEFESYFMVISKIREVVHELRNEYSNKNYGKEMNSLELDLKEVVRNKFPFVLIELTTDFMKVVEN